MEIEPKEIIDGKMDGQHVWICDYRHDDIANKPIRHVEPQQVLIRSNMETKKPIYYSESHFVKLNAKGLPTATIIGLYDNTGYRSITGTAVQVFDNENECRVAYITACECLISSNLTYKDRIVDQVSRRINDLQAKMREQGTQLK